MLIGDKYILYNSYNRSDIYVINIPAYILLHV